MAVMQDKKQKTKTKQYVDQNPIEAIRDLGRGAVQSAATDLGKGVVNEMWNQLLGVSKEKAKKPSGELHEGEEVDLTKLLAQKEETSQTYVEPGIDYKREVIHAEKRILGENQQELSVKVEEILIELKKLTKTSQELAVEFKEVTVEQAPAKPGKYHLAFFEWLLTLVKVARLKVEDSASWLSLFKSKKKQKGYWNMFKKHGTTFGMSSERGIATAAG